MKNVIYLFFLCIGVCSNTFAQLNWETTQLPDDYKTYISAVTAAGTKLVVAGGFNAASETLKDVFIYDTETETWQHDSMSVPRAAFSAIELGSKVYFPGGGVFDNINSVYINQPGMDVYDLVSSTWSYIEIPSKRRWTESVTYNNKLYLIGGRDTSSLFTSYIEAFDPSNNTWEVFDMPIANRSSTAVNIDDRIVIFAEDTCMIWTVPTNEWEIVPFPADRGFFRSYAVTPSKIWFVAGTSMTDTIDIFDYEENTWSTKNTAVVHGYYSLAGYLNGKVYIAGGEDNSAPISVVEVYNTITDQWEELDFLSEARWMFHATRMTAPIIGNRMYFSCGAKDYDAVQLVGTIDILLTDTIIINNTASPTFQFEVNTSPSPFASTLRIETKFKTATSGYIELYDHYGRQIFLQSFENQILISKVIPVEHLPAGDYFVRIKTPEGSKTQKVIKL